MRTYDQKKGKPLNWFNDLTEGEADDLAQVMATPTDEEIEIIKGKMIPQLRAFLNAELTADAGTKAQK